MAKIQAYLSCILITPERSFFGLFQISAIYYFIAWLLTTILHKFFDTMPHIVVHVVINVENKGFVWWFVTLITHRFVINVDVNVHGTTIG